jgi:hypothetical protein
VLEILRVDNVTYSGRWSEVLQDAKNLVLKHSRTGIKSIVGLIQSRASLSTPGQNSSQDTLLSQSPTPKKPPDLTKMHSKLLVALCSILAMVMALPAPGQSLSCHALPFNNRRTMRLTFCISAALEADMAVSDLVGRDPRELPFNPVGYRTGYAYKHKRETED